MPDSTSQQAAPAWRILIDRARTRLWPSAVPDHAPTPDASPDADRQRRLDRTRDLLEQTRDALVERGWTRGGWFSVSTPSGTVRTVAPAEAFGLLAPGSPVTGACLVGAMLQLVENPDTAPSVADAWACVDELHEAIHERMGHVSFPPGRRYSHEVRRVHLRTVTAWNDESGRRLEDVLEVIDRAVARTIVGACAPVA